MDSNKEKSDMGVKKIIEYLESHGYSCEDVSKKGGEYKGCDIVAIKEKDILKIEVKCSQRDLGIPDCFNSEFNNELGFIADYLYILRIDKNKAPLGIDILSKEEINNYQKLHRKVERIRLSSKLKNDLFNKRVGKFISLNNNSLF